MVSVQLSSQQRLLVATIAGKPFFSNHIPSFNHSCRAFSSLPGASNQNQGKNAAPSPSQGFSRESMPSGWEDTDPQIHDFSQLPHRSFGTNQHIRINEDFKEILRQILWEFKAPIRYAFAYGSGVFSQTRGASVSNVTEALSPHPHPPEAVTKWQQGGGKIIDFIFGVSYSQHWHSINLQQHRNHYSALGLLGSYPVARVQDNWGAGVYFNPYINVNGVMVKYGVVNLDVICKDLMEWNTLYLAGRLQKPVKILRDDARVRLANQMNLMSAVRTALLMLPEKFTERQLYERIAGLSYLGDPRMTFGGENPSKVSNIVSSQLPSFRQVYVPLINTLPNVDFSDPSAPTTAGWEREAVMAESRRRDDASQGLSGSDGFGMQQDMNPVRRGNMVSRLPKSFRQRLYLQYERTFRITGRASYENSSHQEGGEFEQRIGASDDLTHVLGQCVRDTVAWPSTSQSIKGVFTSGIGRSWRYYVEKRAKAKQGEAQKRAANGDKPQ